MAAKLRLRDFNVFDKNNELNCLRTETGTLTLTGLFVPIFAEQLLKNMMNTVTVWLMGHISDDAVAAIGVSTQVLTTVTMLYTMVCTGVTVVINQNLGAKRQERASQTATASMHLLLLMSIVLGGLMALLADPVMQLMHLEARLAPDAALFLRITAGFSVFQAIMTCAMAVSRAYGNTFYPVLVSLIMNALNAAGSYIVILRPFETPLSGIFGIATVRILSELFSCLLMLVLLRKVHPGLKLTNMRALSLSIVKDILRIGVPNGMQTLSYSLSQTVTTGVLASLGAAAVASKIYVHNIVYYTYLTGNAMGQANALLVGRLTGMGEHERVYRMTFRHLFLNLALNVTFASIVACARFPLIRLFTQDKEIIAMAAGVIVIDIVVETGRAMNHTFQGALTATGDAAFPMAVMLCTTWGVSVLFAYILGVKMGLGLAGCWIAFAMDELLRGLIQAARWRSRAWIAKSLVKPGR